MKKIKKRIQEIININKDDYVVVAVSAGPDSMFLLDLIYDMSLEFDFKVVCAHVHHNMRKESDEEYEFLKNYCNYRKIVFEFLKLEKIENKNFHDEARKKRYAFFEKVLKKYNSNYLFTAHHGDDLIETILMRIVRGSTLKGYSGFSMIDKRDGYSIVKPLISLTKEEILKYSTENNISFYVDKSNLKDVYTRNRFRKNILPFLKEENPNVHLKFLNFSEELKEYENYINELVLTKKKSIYKDAKINVEWLLKEDLFITKKIIESILKDEFKDMKNINDVHTKLIINLLNSDKPNVILDFPEKIKVIKNYNYIEFKKEKLKTNYNYKLEDGLKLSEGYVFSLIKNTTKKNNYIIRLNSEEVKVPLYVRNRKQGDKIILKGTKGSKKVKDIFIDNKIPLEKRNSWPIVVDSNDEILWIPGLKKSKKDKKINEKCDIIIKCQ